MIHELKELLRQHKIDVPNDIDPNDSDGGNSSGGGGSDTSTRPKKRKQMRNSSEYWGTGPLSLDEALAKRRAFEEDEEANASLAARKRQAAAEKSNQNLVRLRMEG